MRASVTSLTKKFISTFFAATLVMGLVPAAAFAANEDNGNDESTNSVISTEASDSERSGEISPTEDIQDEFVPATDELQDDLVGDALASSNGEDGIEGNATTGEGSNLSIPAATERINEDMLLTTPVAQQETTRNYFLAQTLESTRTIPIVSANLPLDTGIVDVDVVNEPDAEGEGSNASEEDGESPDDPDSNSNLEMTEDPVDASFTLASSESDSAVSAESTVIGSFTYRGITYAVEPGGETVAIVAADYTKLPEDFIEAKAIVLPSMVTADAIDYYSVTRIADYAFASLTEENCRRLIHVAPDGEDATEDEAAKGEDSNPDPETLGIDAITVPASITKIGDNAYTDFNTLQYIIVSDDNPNYSQYDGCLYDKPQNCLLLIPEGRLGAVRVAPSVTEVSPEAFSHCPSVDTLVADPDSAAYQLLVTNDLHKDKYEIQALTEFANASSTCFDGFWAEHSDGIECLMADEERFELASMLGSRITLYDSAVATKLNAGDPGKAWSYVTMYNLSSYSSGSSSNKEINTFSEPQGALVVGQHTDSSVGVGTLRTGGAGQSASASMTYFNRFATKATLGYVGLMPTHANKDSDDKNIATKAIYDSTFGLFIHTYGKATDSARETRLTQNMNEGISGAPAVLRANLSCNAIEVYKRSSPGTINGQAQNTFGVSSGDMSTIPSAFGQSDMLSRYIQYAFVLKGSTSVTINPNGGTYNGSTGNATISSVQSPYTPPSNLTRTGYNLKGWTTSNSDYAWAQSGTSTPKSVNSTTGCYDLGTKFMIRKDVTFTAQWAPATYTITYNMNGHGTAPSTTDTYTYGTGKSSLPNPAAVTGYTFGGWYKESGCTNQVTSISSTDYGNKTFYAKWTPNTYYVGYVANGGSGTMTSTTATYDSNVTLKANGYTAPTGKHFTYWNTNSAGTGTNYSANTTYTKPNFTSTAYGDYTLYAKWDPNVCTVKYNANGGGGTMADTTHTYGTASTLRTNGFTAPNGKYFNGWKTADGTAYSSGQNMTYHGLSHNATITLYAQWAYINYSVTYNTNGGTLAAGTANPTYYNIDAATFNLATATRTGFSFQGWKTASNLSGNSMTQVTKGSQVNYTVYANWGVTFNWYYYDGQLDNGMTQTGYGASTAYTSVSTTAPSSLTYSYLVPVGWTLHQWSRSASGDNNNVDLGKTAYAYSNTNANNYYAKYKADIYQNLNYGGAAATYLTTVYGYGKNPTGTYKPADPAARTGYTFDGWNVDYAAVTLADDNSKYKNSNITFKGAATIVAQWSANSYNVRYNANGGKGTMAASVHYYDTAKNLIKNAFTRDGYTYNGWNTQADGKGTAYKDEQEVKNLASATGANFDLYAQWNANDYKIRFDPNGGTGGITGPIDVTFDSALPKLEGDWKPVAPEGYEFNGWWDTAEKTRGNQYYGPNGDATQTKYDLVADNVTLYARWSRLPFHAITLKDERLDVKDGSIWFWPPTKGYTPDDPNGFPVDGTMDHLIRIVKKDNKIVDLTDPIFSDEDYEFLGYFDKKQGEEDAVQKIDADGNLKTEEPITRATVWYAHWVRHGSTVKLQADYGKMVSEDIVQGTDRIDHVSFGKDFATPTGENATRIENIAQTPSRVGYTFMGYYTKENPELSTDDVKNGNFKGTCWIHGEGEEDVSAGTLVANEWPSEADWRKLGLDDEEDSNTIVLYAAWQLDDCIVEFEIEDNLEDNTERVFVPEGSTALDDRIWHYNKNMADKLPVPGDATFSRNGYDFGGWYYLKDGETVTRVCDKDGNPDANALLPWKDPVKNVTLYAYWTPRHYAVQFDPAFPNIEGVTRVYDGPKDKVELDYDDALEMHAPDFGAYDFKGWYVGVPDGMGGWKASDVPFSDWTLRNGEEVKGLHTTAMVKQDGASYVTYEGRFTPHDPLVGQTYDEASPEPAVIHVVAKWEDPVKRYIHFYAGLPEESLDESTRDYEPEYYKFAKAYPIDPTYLPNVGKDGWKCKGWVEVDSEEEALEYLKSGYVGDEKDPGVSNIEAKTTRAAYHDLYFVAKWTICPLSVTLVTEENEDGTFVKGTDALVDADSWNATPKTDSLYAKAYDVRQAAFTLPNLSRKGYDFKGWVRQGSDDAEPKRDYAIDPANQAKLEANHDLVFEPVFEEIEYTIYLEPNGGGLERQERKAKFTELFDFAGSYPAALHTGSVFKAWATKKQKPMEDLDGTYREFTITSKVPMSEETEGMEDAPFYLTDLTDDESRTIYLYGIWFGDFYSVEVPLTVNMAVDTETGDVVAAKTTLKPRKGNEDKVYTVESLRYEPVSDERGVPFQGASNVYFSVYPGITFQNDADAYYFLQKDKVGEKGAVTYTNAKGDLVTSTPLLIELGRASATPKLFTKTKSTTDADEATLDSMTDGTSGFYSFSAEKPLDVYYGLHFEGEKRDWVNVLQRYAYGNNGSGWELPENDAGYQRYTGLPDDEGRRLGWSSDRVDIAKVRYTLSMQTKSQ